MHPVYLSTLALALHPPSSLSYALCLTPVPLPHSFPPFEHTSHPFPPSQSQQLAQELTTKLPAAALAGLVATLSAASPALAVDYAPAPEATSVIAEQQQAPSSFTFQGATQVRQCCREPGVLRGLIRQALVHFRVTVCCGLCCVMPQQSSQ
jgi:hypothetical protein